MSERLTLQDLIDLLAQQQELTKKDAENFLRELIALISETVEKNESVKIKDFGAFKLVKVNARKSVDVNTGDEIEISAHYKLTFTPDKSLREAINKPFAHFESVVLEDGVNFENISFTGMEDGEDSEDPNLEGTEISESTTTTTIDIVEKGVVEDIIIEEVTIEETTILLEENPIEDEELATNKVGAVFSEISASMDAFKNDGNISDEDNKILASMTLSQKEYEITDKENNKNNQDVVDNNNNNNTNANKEENPKKESIEESISRILESKKEDKNIEIQTIKTTESKEEITAIAHKETSQEATTIDDKKVEIKEEPIIENQRIAESEDSVNPLNTSDMDENYNNDEYEDDYNEYESNNTKTYIYLGIALVAIILAVVFIKFYNKKPDTKPVAETEKVADSLDVAKNDSTLDATDEIIAQNEKEIKQKEEAAKNKNVADLGTETIKQGQTLRLISLKHYGHKAFWVYIYQANKGKIKNPNSVAIGTKLVIPSLDKFNVNPKDQKEISKALKMESEIISRTAN